MSSLTIQPWEDADVHNHSDQFQWQNIMQDSQMKYWQETRCCENMNWTEMVQNYVMWLDIMLLTPNFWVPSLEREPPKILAALYWNKNVTNRNQITHISYNLTDTQGKF